MFKQKGSILSNLTFSCKNMLQGCKIRLIITYSLMILGLIVGIFVAIHLKNNSLIGSASEYGFVSLNYTGLSSFFWRLFSFAIISLLLLLFSLTIFTFPIGELILLYRAYLVGLNVVILTVFSGLSGLFTTILIILPCQLFALLVLGSYFCLFSKNCKEPGKAKWKILLVTLCILFLIDIVESILLFVFGANIILVI